MKISVHKVTAISLALLFLGFPTVLSARERRGAQLVITLKDGHLIGGELVAVKPDSILLLSPAMKDESVDVASIRSIRIVRKSKALLGAACGFLAAGVATAIVVSGHKETDNPWTIFWQGMEAGEAAVAFGSIGLGIGIGGGLLAGKDKTVQLEGKSESAVKSVLADLRNKARVRDFK
jgi:hypothetical protein